MVTYNPLVLLLYTAYHGLRCISQRRFPFHIFDKPVYLEHYDLDAS